MATDTSSNSAGSSPHRGESPADVLPQLRLDELLAEVQTRLAALADARDRMRGLLNAVLAVGSELELEQVLRRIIEAAMELVDARYGAMGVLDEDAGGLARFIPVGMTQEQIDQIGPYPSGKGILGLLIHQPQVLRLASIADHEAAVGFPPGHPPMRTFIGAPIRVRERVFGNLYLSERHGGGEFDPDDETVLQALASAAGVAIDNARLYAQARQRELWMAAASEVAQQLLSGTATDEVLDLVLQRSRAIAEADLVAIGLPAADGDGMRIEHASGIEAERFLGTRLPSDRSVSALVERTGEAVIVTDVRQDGRVAAPVRESGIVGPAAYVPLVAPDRVRGVLMVGNAPGGAMFTAQTVEVLRGFAQQAAVALELADRRRDAERLTVFEDRDRIARDLHDLVIQRLFATSMSLQSITRLIDNPQATTRIHRAVGDLDETIKDIRSTIFALHDHDEPDGTSLRQRIAAEVDAARAALGFSPAIRFTGPVDTLTDEHVSEQVVAVVREALANCAKHAKASHVDVEVQATPDLLQVTVRDNGVGLPASGRRSGLANLAARAQALGGTMTAACIPAGGTELAWAAPLGRAVSRTASPSGR